MNKKRQSSCRIPSQNCIKGGGGLWGGIRKGPRLWQQDTTQTWKNDQEKRKEIRNEEITATNSNWNFPEAFSNGVIGWLSTPSYRVAEYVNLGYRVANSFHWLKSGPEVTGYRVASYRVGSTTLSRSCQNLLETAPNLAVSGPRPRGTFNTTWYVACVPKNSS